MVPTDRLWETAERQGIAIEWRRLDQIVALYLYRPDLDRPVIILSDKLRSERKLRTILAHELGHHFTCAGSWLSAAYTDTIVPNKAERRANVWAAWFLLPCELLERQLREGVDPCEANLVEPWLVQVAIAEYWPLRAA